MILLPKRVCVWHDRYPRRSPESLHEMEKASPLKRCHKFQAMLTGFCILTGREWTSDKERQQTWPFESHPLANQSRRGSGDTSRGTATRNTETRKATAQGAKENDTEQSELQKHNSLRPLNREGGILSHMNCS